MLRLQVKALALIAGLLVIGGLSAWAIVRVMPDKPSGPSKVTETRTVYLRAAKQTDTVRVTIREQVVRWQVDTLWRSDTITVNDTVRVLIPAPTLARMDSTIRACAKLDTLVSQERSACERVQQALRDSIRTLQPSKWRHLRDASLLVGGIILGAKVVR